MMLKDKVALVTGGASGIGRATAIAFGAAGAKVVFCDRPDVDGEETAALIRDTGAECLFVKADVSSEADVQALVQKATLAVSAKQRATYGKLDCAFNFTVIVVTAPSAFAALVMDLMAHPSRSGVDSSAVKLSPVCPAG
jgi:NAD(P)-dependent dehydrogenase (short-subunit alcohol dehydrogenase family)